MPDFSLQDCAGKTISAQRKVSLSLEHSETITKSQAAKAWRNLSASGRLTTGLVATIQIAFTFPSRMASATSQALTPTLGAIGWGDCQNSPTD